jgi:uncharacterized membrane protein
MEAHKPKQCIGKCFVTLAASGVIVLTVVFSWIFGISIQHYGSITIFFMAFVIMCDCLQRYADLSIHDEERRLHVMRLIYTVALIAILIGLFVFVYFKR